MEDRWSGSLRNGDERSDNGAVTVAVGVIRGADEVERKYDFDGRRCFLDPLYEAEQCMRKTEWSHGNDCGSEGPSWHSDGLVTAYS